MAQYTAAERAAALQTLAEHDGNYRTAARETGVNADTLRRWYERANDPGAALDDIGGTLAVQARKLADDLLDGEHVQAPLNQRASALGMLVDRLIKLEERHRAHAPGTSDARETVIRVEYVDGGWGGGDANDDD